MTWLIGIGIWCLLSIGLAGLYSAIRTYEKIRDEQVASGINGSIEL